MTSQGIGIFHMRALTFCLLLSVVLPAVHCATGLALLDVDTHGKQHVSHRFQETLREELEVLDEVTLLSTEEISLLRRQGLIEREIPSPSQQKRITEIFGPLIVVRVFLDRDRESRHLSWWPPGILNLVFLSRAEMTVMHTESGKVLYSGNIETSFVLPRPFSFRNLLHSLPPGPEEREQAHRALTASLAKRCAEKLRAIGLSLSQ